jgi:hypothetical protein
MCKGALRGNPHKMEIHPYGGIIYLRVDHGCSYDKHEFTLKGKESHELKNPLHMENPMGDRMSHIPKGVYKRSLHNPNARSAPNYSIFEDLAQTPCEMLAL